MALRTVIRSGKYFAVGTLFLGMAAAPGLAAVRAAITPVVLTVGVDHIDAANQDPANGRLFEYTDFFSHEITVHQGAVVNFQTAPGAFHIVALARSEAVARRAYPVATADRDDPNTALGVPKIGFGPSNFPIVHGNTNGNLSAVDFSKPNGPPDCGVPALGQADCVFPGGNDIEVAGPNLTFDAHGNPLPADWRVKITAAPGEYTFFCYVHPGMRGELKVVDADEPVTTQSQVNASSARQFTAEQSAALSAEKAANKVSFTGGKPGHRQYIVHVGIAAADNHVAIDEMLPSPVTVKQPALKAGDTIRYLWRDPHNVHSVFFPAMPGIGFTNDVGPFGFDCTSGYVPAGPAPPCKEGAEGVEFIADPGNAGNHTALVSPTKTLDSGVLIGKDYGVRPSVQQWTVKVTAGTGAGRYLFHCTVHDFMVGAITVTK